LKLYLFGMDNRVTVGEKETYIPFCSYKFLIE